MPAELQYRRRPGRPKSEALEELCRGLIEALWRGAYDLRAEGFKSQAVDASNRAREAGELLEKIIAKESEDDG